MVGAAAQVWAASPLRGAMAIDRLMAQRLASGAAIVAWAFSALQTKRCACSAVLQCQTVQALPSCHSQGLTQGSVVDLLLLSSEPCAMQITSVAACHPTPYAD